jgi:hypothetical protein
LVTSRVSCHKNASRSSSASRSARGEAGVALERRQLRLGVRPPVVNALNPRLQRPLKLGHVHQPLASLELDEHPLA